MHARSWAIALLAISATTHAAGDPDVVLVIRDHRFSPAEVRIPANTRVRLLIDNQDATPEEFDSHALNREKVIPPRSKANVFIGPLTPGRYPFMGEFNASTAQGAVVVE